MKRHAVNFEKMAVYYINKYEIRLYDIKNLYKS